MAERAIAVRLRAEVSDFKRQIGEATKTSKELSAAFDASGKKIDTTLGRMVRSAEVNRQAWTNMGAAATAFGAAAAAGVALATKAAVDWESAWTGVLKTVDGTAQQYATLEADLRGMTAEVSASHTEIAAVAEAAGQLGIAVDDVAAFTRTMIDLGETTNLTADQAATTLARMANIMGTAAPDIARMGATIVDLGNNAATTESEITDLALRLAAAGKQAGLSEAEVLAFASTLSSVGIEAEAGGTAISKVFTSVADAVRSGSSDLTTFAQVAGQSVASFTDAFNNDPAAAVGAFIEGMGRLANAGQSTSAIFNDLELTDSRLQRAVLSTGSAAGLLGDQIDTANTAWAENVALVEEAEKRYDTTAAKLEIARNSINDAAITVGETFLPVLALGAEGVGALANAFGSLPTAAQGTAGVLTAIAGAAGLTGGAFFLLFPRVLEAVEGLRQLGVISPRAVSGLGRVARGLGHVAAAATRATVALAATSIGIAIMNDQTVETAGVGQFTDALLDVAKGADIATTSLAALFDSGGTSDWFNGNDIDSIGAAFERITNAAGDERLADFINEIGSFGQSSSAALEQSTTIFEGIDQGLASLVQSGNADKASAALSQLAAQIGTDRKSLRALLPEYVDSLHAADAAQETAAESSEAYALAQENLAAAQEEAFAALDAWREGVQAANAAFIDLGGAYDTVVAKNTELAQSTADATKSTKDSWESYYDGVSVKAKDLITEMQAQVDAQNNWEENIVAIATRVRDELPESATDAATDMVNELINMGPEGAAMVTALKGASDEEFATLVELWGERGDDAIGAFRERVEGILEPVKIPVDVDMSAASGTVQRWFADMGVNPVPDGLRSPGTQRSPGFGRQVPGFKDGGRILGAGTPTSDSIPILASNNEHMWDAAAVRGAGGHDVVDSLRALAREGRLFENWGARNYDSQQPTVVAVPIEQRHETHAPIVVNTSASTIRDIEDEIRRRRRSTGGF